MGDKVQVEFGAGVDAFNANVKRAEQTMAQFSSGVRNSLASLQSPFEQLHGWMSKIAAMAAGGVFASFVSSSVEATTETVKLAKSFGISTEEASTLRTQLQAARISVEDYSGAALKLDRQVRQNESALKQAGLATRDASGHFLSQQQLMQNAIEVLASYGEGVDRNIAAQILFGRGASETAQFLRLNSEAIARAAKSQRELGLSITSADAERVKAYKVAISEMNMSFEGLKKVVGDAVLPSLISFAEHVREAAPAAIRRLRADLQVLGETYGEVKKAASQFGGILTDLLKLLGQGQWSSFKDMMSQTAVEFARLGFWAQVARGWIANPSDRDAQKRVLQEALNDYSQFITKRSDLAKAAGIDDIGSVTGSDKPPAGRSAVDLLKIEERRKAAMLAKDADIKEERLTLAETKVLYEAGVANLRITENEKFALIMNASEQAYQIELTLLEEKKALAGSEVALRQKVENEISELRGRHRVEQKQLDADSIRAQTQMWRSYLSDISGAFRSQLSGLLTGTLTFAQAFRNAMLDMTLKIVGYIEKLALDWAAAQLGMTTASQTGALAQAAATQEAMVLTLPSRIAKFTSDIAAMGALTFAGIMANLSPLLGPAAAGPAAVGEATVLAQLANVPKLDVGGLVLNDGYAMIHKGERVTPANVKTPFDPGMGHQSGGNTINLSYVANGRLTKAEIKENALTIARAISDVLPGNNSRLKFS
jgi:hypothetical protein